MSETILDIQNLSVEFRTYEGAVAAVNGLDYTVKAGQTLGIIGESGSGKSVSSMAVMKLIPEPPGWINPVSSMSFMGRNLMTLSKHQMAKVRGNQISMIFQDPMTSLNPFLRIEAQMIEGLVHHQGVSKERAVKKALEMLEYVQVPDAAARMKAYPHELSGGMRQRVMIAMSLTSDPKLIFADEPTTALDVTVQAQILKLFSQMKRKFDASIVFISHDLEVIASESDCILVMYAGRVVESGPPELVFEDPKHPYTIGLKQSLPRIKGPRAELVPIAGLPPDLRRLPSGCAFADRCPFVEDDCRQGKIALRGLDDGRLVRCKKV